MFKVQYFIFKFYSVRSCKNNCSWSALCVAAKVSLALEKIKLVEALNFLLSFGNVD